MLLKLIGHEFHNPERSGNCEPLFVICWSPVKLIAESRRIQQNHHQCRSLHGTLMFFLNKGVFVDVFNEVRRDTDSLPKNGREATRPQRNTEHLVNYRDSAGFQRCCCQSQPRSRTSGTIPECHRRVMHLLPRAATLGASLWRSTERHTQGARCSRSHFIIWLAPQRVITGAASGASPRRRNCW